MSYSKGDKVVVVAAPTNEDYVGMTPADVEGLSGVVEEIMEEANHVYFGVELTNGESWYFQTKHLQPEQDYSDEAVADEVGA